MNKGACSAAALVSGGGRPFDMDKWGYERDLEPDLLTAPAAVAGRFMSLSARKKTLPDVHAARLRVSRDVLQ
jgi:hypothetical protein